MNAPNSHFLTLLAVLEPLQSDLVLIGGLAAILQGYDRLTYDADFVVRDTRAIDASMTSALTSAQYRLVPPERTDIPPHTHWTAIGRRRAACWLFRESSIPFDVLARAADTLMVSATSVRIANVEHLAQLENRHPSTPGTRRHSALLSSPLLKPIELQLDADGHPTGGWSFEDADALRRWTFRQRTPLQRLGWIESVIPLVGLARRKSNSEPSTQLTTWGDVGQ